ncbi:MAG: phosphatidate cytidylyltransferase [Chitinophagaceae bacterium]
MAFNWQTFKTRTLTAIIFAAVMLTGLLWNQWSFLVLFSIIHFGCWWEYFQIIEKIHAIAFHIYVKLGLMLAGYGLMVWFCSPAFQITGYGLKENFSLPLSGAGFALLLIGIFQKNKIELKSFGAAASGLLYISLSWGLMLSLYGIANVYFKESLFVLEAGSVPIIIILSIWINDTMAYIVGSLVGKTPLSKISPKKTWEGTIGGIILSIGVVSFIFPLFLFHSPDFSFSIFLALITGIAAITGTLGDLLESKIKRMAGIKDSGQIMPGHGGFLDRFDSLLLAIPFVWLFFNFVIN